MILNQRWRNSLHYILAALIAWGLKYHYSRADCAELVWILAPTAGLVELVGGIPFEYEAHTGFVSRRYRVVIAPSCAGVNFMLIAFCMAAFAGIQAFERRRSKLLWLGAGCLSAYLLTVAVNTVRIIVSIHSFNADVGLGWMTAARVHRLEGIVIYSFFLGLFYMIIRQMHCYLAGGTDDPKPDRGTPNDCLERASDYLRRACSGLAPLFWYGLIALGVPLANGAWRADAVLFAEHGAMVLTAGSGVLGALYLLRVAGRNILHHLSKLAFEARRKIVRGTDK